MWNNQEHLEAYLAVPAMGAVLHTLNLRLFPEQLVYIANHAEDEVVIVDGSVAAAARQGAGAAGDGGARGRGRAAADADALAGDRRDRALVRRAARRPARTSSTGPTSTSATPPRMCYTSGTTGNPKGVVYSHRSIYLHSMQVCMARRRSASSQADRVLPVVPMFHAMAWGLPYAALMCGASLLMPDRFLQAEPLAAMIAAERPTLAGAVPTIWTDLLALPRREPDATSRRSREVDRRRLGLPAGADAGASRSGTASSSSTPGG